MNPTMSPSVFYAVVLTALAVALSVWLKLPPLMSFTTGLAAGAIGVWMGEVQRR